MNNILASFYEMISKDRKSVNISMLNEGFRDLTAFGVVEFSIGIRSFVPVLKNGKSKDI